MFKKEQKSHVLTPLHLNELKLKHGHTGLELTRLGSGHVGQDPEGLGPHVAAAVPSVAHVRVFVGALDSLIDGGAAVYQTFSNWDSTATTHRGRRAPPQHSR